MTDLTPLISKLEAAGPSRELDAEIASAVGWVLTAYGWQDAQGMSWSPPGASMPQYGALPSFSSSLDAAMTLVPDRFGWLVGSDGEAEVFEIEAGTPRHTAAYVNRAATPALALCAAALRAIQETRNG